MESEQESWPFLVLQWWELCLLCAIADRKQIPSSPVGKPLGAQIRVGVLNLPSGKITLKLGEVTNPESF